MIDKKMIDQKLIIPIALVTAFAFASTLAPAQKPLISGSRLPTPKLAAVEFLTPQQVTVPASKPTTVALRFRIAPGLHINSHTPRQTELIPTTYSIPEGSGVHLDKAIYPPGAEFTLPLDPDTKLNVYTGEFVIQARLVVKPGDHLVEARLHYQACDNNACMPPKTITAAIDLIGK